MELVDDAVRELTKDIGKAVRPHGFKGSGGTWRRASPDGFASIHRWTALVPGGREMVKRIGLTAETVPVAWWRFTAWESRRAGQFVFPIERLAGPRLLDQLHPSCVWDVRRGIWGAPNPVAGDVAVIRESLPATVDALAAMLVDHLTGDRYLEELLAHPGKGVDEWKMIAIWHAGEGAAEELEKTLAEFAVALPTEYREHGEVLRQYAEDVAAGKA